MSQIKQFARDVREGLSGSRRSIPSKWFYDQVGDELFVQIMHMPEYYLTPAEFEIFSERNDELIEGLNVMPERHFDLVELGAGDGTKTKELIAVLMRKGYDFDYLPIDISSHALQSLEADLRERWPAIRVEPRQGLYFDVLKNLANMDQPKVVLFLGSNLGNLTDERAAAFLKQLGACLRKGDRVLIGLDLIKPAEIVLPAYSDEAGITSRFNLNLLERINRELGGNFDVSKFRHEADYREDEGIARSYLVSLEDQHVRIDSLNETYAFRKGERIHTEVSRKYNADILEAILRDSGMEVVQHVTDEKGYFADFILKRS